MDILDKLILYESSDEQIIEEFHRRSSRNDPMCQSTPSRESRGRPDRKMCSKQQGTELKDNEGDDPGEKE